MKKSKKKKADKCLSIQNKVKALKKKTIKAKAQKKKRKAAYDKKMDKLVDKLAPYKDALVAAKKEYHQSEKALKKALIELAKCETPKKKAQSKKRQSTKSSSKTKQTKVKKSKVRIAKVAVTESAPIVSIEPDNLKKIEGIGPKIERLLHAGGILTFKQLAAAEVIAVKAILLAAGSRYRMHDPTTWGEQAGLAAKEDWEGLKVLQDELKGGKRV